MKFISPKDFADLLKVSRQHVLGLIHTGRLPAVKVGPRSYRIAQGDADKFLAQSRLRVAS